MVPGVDNKVVEMQFNNGIFERRIADTLKSLDKLNNSLKFSNAGAGVNDINSAVKGFNLNPMSSAIEGVSKKWLALSTIAITALANITSRAVDAGISLAKSLTLDNIIDGFREYELNIGSIQTILANTRADGTNLQDVNAALDELNAFADLTIYNFAEMTRNIGTFTAAGVELDTSVNAIKGIANLAAISGSNSQQASTAMYQLSQAISTGSLRLQDWNSVVNAGLGGEVFQRALFETGKAMGTLTDVALDTTFEEWQEAGNNFRESLQEEWITADVLTNTLGVISNDLSDAQLAAIGYSEAQIAAARELGELGVESATKVRTLTQLIDTAKEAIASGWSQSFRTIFGDFTEATELFTGISDAVNGMISASSDARNEMLDDWDELGGRTVLIDGLRTAFQALGEIFAPIRQAFRDIFPRTTGQRLFELTEGFAALAERLIPSEQTVENLRRAFGGLFSALDIGWTVIKEGARFIVDLYTALTGVGSGDILSFFANVGDVVSSLRDNLVDGGGIAGFFDDISESIKDPIQLIRDFKSALVDLVDNVLSNARDFAPESLLGFFDFLRARFGGLIDLAGGVTERLFSFDLDRILGPFANIARNIIDILETVFDTVTDYFGELAARMAGEVQEGDFSLVGDIISLGILGGLGTALTNSLRGGGGLREGIDNFFGGLTSLFGRGEALLNNISSTFRELTGVLSAMQQEIKANTLLKIATALAVLTGSVILLSAVDSEALAKALTAMAVGFGQLLASFAILTKISLGPSTAASFGIIAAGMILFAGALAALSIAVSLFGRLDVDELAKGLAGVATGMGLLTTASVVLSRYSGGMARAAFGMTGMAVAMIVLAGAVKLFSMMSWPELARGLTAVAVGLGAMTAAMAVLPSGLVLKSVGLVAMAVAINIMAVAVKQLSSLNWEEIAKGLAAVAGVLGAVALAANLMPGGMVRIGIGLLAIGGALLLIGQFIESVADISWEDLGKGLATMAVALGTFALVSNAASGGLAGAIALGVLSVSMRLFADALEKIGNLSIAKIVTSIATLAGVILTMAGLSALLSGVAPAILLFSVALGALGIAILAVGAGAYLLVRAFQILSSIGKDSLGDFIKFIGEFINQLPGLIGAFVQSVIDVIIGVLEAAPVLIEELVNVFSSILDGIIDLLPKVAETVGTFISEILTVIREKFPELVETGFEMLLALLQGIEDNIGEIVQSVVRIITTFLDTLSQEIPTLIDSVFNFLKAVVIGVAAKGAELAAEIAPVGRDLIAGLLSGIQTFATDELIPWFQALPGNAISWIGDVITTLFDLGVDILTGFLEGVVNFADDEVIPWFGNLPGNVVDWIGNVLSTLVSRGWDILTGFLTGITNFATQRLTPWLAALPRRVVTWIGNVLTTLRDTGYNIIVGFYNGIIEFVNASLIPWFGDLGNKIRSWIPDALRMLKNIGSDIIQGLWDGMKSKFEDVKNWAVRKAGEIKNWFADPLAIFSPSRVFMELGEYTMEGFRLGIESGYSDVERVARSFDPEKLIRGDEWNRAFEQIVAGLGDLNALEPRITPVLDLSNVEAGSRRLAALTGAPVIDTDYSYRQAAAIASSRSVVGSDQGEPRTGGVRFEQNIYAPEQLSTSDIYRQTRNQLRVAAEELDVP